MFQLKLQQHTVFCFILYWIRLKIILSVFYVKFSLQCIYKLAYGTIILSFTDVFYVFCCILFLLLCTFT